MNPKPGNTIKFYLHKLVFELPLRNRLQLLSFQKILEKNYPAGSNFSFIQVGANDGVSHDFLFDFIRKRQARGLVIEPLPDLFEKLLHHYSFNQEVIAVNKAVHPESSTINLYRLDPAQAHLYPEWASGIASVNKDHHTKSGIPSSAMISQQVTAARLMDIISENNFSLPVDLLQIDAEGFDFEILKLADLDILQPAIVRFEIINLSREDGKSAVQLLKNKGYHCLQDGYDIIALQLHKLQL
ncbi:MAG: FkbM family methyltransferase [Flavisolibacter sp.]